MWVWKSGTSPAAVVNGVTGPVEALVPCRGPSRVHVSVTGVAGAQGLWLRVRWCCGDQVTAESMWLATYAALPYEWAVLRLPGTAQGSCGRSVDRGWMLLGMLKQWRRRCMDMVAISAALSCVAAVVVRRPPSPPHLCCSNRIVQPPVAVMQGKWWARASAGSAAGQRPGSMG